MSRATLQLAVVPGLACLTLAVSFLMTGCTQFPGTNDLDDSTPGPEDSTWRSELYPETWTPDLTDTEGRFLHDFSYAGYRNGEVPLPSVAPGSTFDVLDYGADPSGLSDSGVAIQSAIDDAEAAGGGRVHLPAGEYRVDDLLRVEGSGIVITGAGRQQTFLYFTRTGDMTDRAHLTFRGDLTPGEPLLLTTNGEPRSHDLLIDDASGLETGDEVSVGWMISQGFVEDHGMDAFWESRQDSWRPFFRRSVLSVDTTSTPHRVTLDVPLRYPALVRDDASLRPESGYLSECGVEDLSLSTVGPHEAAWALDRSHALAFIQTKDCWMRRVDSYESPASEGGGFHLLSGGVKVQESKRVTIADSRLEAPQNRGGGGNGYLFEVTRSSEVLTRDCVARAGRHNFIQNWDFGTSGCVWLRTESSEGRAYFSASDPVGQLGFSEFHHSLAMANLIDDSLVDDGWQGVNRKAWSSGSGHSASQNVFWNLRGAGELKSFQYGWGYVIGTKGLTVHTDLEDDGFFGEGDGTAPADWVEGRELAEELRPRSLYEDQLARRLAP